MTNTCARNAPPPVLPSLLSPSPPLHTPRAAPTTQKVPILPSQHLLFVQFSQLGSRAYLVKDNPPRRLPSLRPVEQLNPLAATHLGPVCSSLCASLTARPCDSSFLFFIIKVQPCDNRMPKPIKGKHACIVCAESWFGP